MENSNCNSNLSTSKDTQDYETIRLEKTRKVCGLCEDFAKTKSEKDNLVAIMSCEGACLRGEVSRRVANSLCFDKMPDSTARVCLGGAFTKNTGQRNMVRNAGRVIALEGCLIECASRMMKAVVPGLRTEVIHVDKYYNFDKNLFAINDATEEELKIYSEEASRRIYEIINS